MRWTGSMCSFPGQRCGRCLSRKLVRNLTDQEIGGCVCAYLLYIGNSCCRQCHLYRLSKHSLVHDVSKHPRYSVRVLQLSRHPQSDMQHLQRHTKSLWETSSSHSLLEGEPVDHLEMKGSEGMAAGSRNWKGLASLPQWC